MSTTYHSVNSHPYVYCEKCGMKRDCMEHLRAEFPPDAAKKWLKKHHAPCDGEIKYMCGFGIGSKPTGQSPR